MGRGGRLTHIVEASFVIIYILNIFVAAFLLFSDSELLEDLDTLVLYAHMVIGLKKVLNVSILGQDIKGYIKFSSLNDH